jgi:hypothetical protein
MLVLMRGSDKRDKLQGSSRRKLLRTVMRTVTFQITLTIILENTDTYFQHSTSQDLEPLSLEVEHRLFSRGRSRSVPIHDN